MHDRLRLAVVFIDAVVALEAKVVVRVVVRELVALLMRPNLVTGVVREGDGAERAEDAHERDPQSL
jgi:hypothetical protein